jgi:hypothetical protein
MPARDTSQSGERLDMAFQECLLGAGGVHAMDGFSRVREPEREHVAPGPDPCQIHPHITEIHLSLRAGGVFLWHEDLHRGVPCLDGDSGPVGLDVLADGGVRDHGLVLVNQAIKNPLGGMALLPRSVQVSQEHRINDAFERTQL